MAELRIEKPIAKQANYTSVKIEPKENLKPIFKNSNATGLDTLSLQESKKIINFDNTDNGKKLCEAIKKNIKPKSTGFCYRAVKAAIKEAGLGELEGASAYKAANQLANMKTFNEIKGLKLEDFSVLPKGSVIV